MGKKRKEYQAGHLFGDVIYLNEEPDKMYSSGPSRMARFRCQCGKEFVTNMSSVNKGATRSCGCIPAFKTHGLSSHPLYNHWAHMTTRCLNPNHSDYHRYGGRGIGIHKDWVKTPEAYIDYISTLENFGKEGYDTIDRIDNDGDYEPGNIQWATWSMQAQNKSTPKSKSGYVGVYGRDKAKNGNIRYVARVWHNGQRALLSGTTKTPQESAVKRDWYIVINGLNQRLQVLNSPQ